MDMVSPYAPGFVLWNYDWRLIVLRLAYITNPKHKLINRPRIPSPEILEWQRASGNMMARDPPVATYTDVIMITLNHQNINYSNALNKTHLELNPHPRKMAKLIWLLIHHVYYGMLSISSQLKQFLTILIMLKHFVTKYYANHKRLFPGGPLPHTKKVVQIPHVIGLNLCLLASFKAAFDPLYLIQQTWDNSNLRQVSRIWCWGLDCCNDSYKSPCIPRPPPNSKQLFTHILWNHWYNVFRFSFVISPMSFAKYKQYTILTRIECPASKIGSFFIQLLPTFTTH